MSSHRAVVDNVLTIESHGYSDELPEMLRGIAEEVESHGVNRVSNLSFDTYESMGRQYVGISFKGGRVERKHNG